MATLTETFTNIADAIRLKTETTDKITPENMPSMIEGITTGGNVMELSITSNGTYRAPEGIDGYTPVIVNVPQDGSPPAEALIIAGDCNNRFANGGWDWFVRQYASQMTTNNIINAEFMFNGCKATFTADINLADTTSSIEMGSMFASSNMTTYPNIYGIAGNLGNFFSGADCEYINNFWENIDWSWYENIEEGNGWDGNRGWTFGNCLYLKNAPVGFLAHGSPNPWGSNSVYYHTFYQCLELEEILDMPVPHNFIEGTDGLDGFVDNCVKLRRLTFALGDDGNPINVKWGGQTLNLSGRVGGWDNPPDRVYNLTSAIETIHTLPDASNWINEGNDMNIIKFSPDAGSNTGGRIGDMSEEDIAVAVAKGWTVAFE